MMNATNTKSCRPYPGHRSRLRKVSRGLGLTSALVLQLLTATGRPSEARDCADVDLVLAIDGSGSIDAAEFSLQQHGYSAAFRRKDVQQALLAAGTVDVAVVLWGDTEIAVQILPWVRLSDSGSAEALALEIERLNRRVQGNTGLGRALWQALDLLALPGQCGLRKIVNVSGDGPETVTPHPRGHVPLALARNRAEAMQVVVNALAVDVADVDLADWYHDWLLVGPGAFVMRVEGFGSFADAIAKKLIREIMPPDVALSPFSAADRKS